MSLATVNVTDAVTPILPAVSARATATLWNDGFFPCFIKWDGSADALTAANGEVLPPKTRMVLDSAAAITGRCATGHTTTLRVQDTSTP